MNAILVSTALLTIAVSASAFAQQPATRLGEHPAVIVKRAAEKQTYDYASKFYPHPAWLYLRGSSESMIAKDDIEPAQKHAERTEGSASSATTAANLSATQRP